MTKQEMLEYGANTFGYNPSEPFSNLDELLYRAKADNTCRSYCCGAAILAEIMARYIDESEVKDESI